MWQNYYTKLQQYQSQYTTKEYCEVFLSFINPNTKIWDIELLKNKLSNNDLQNGLNLELFPEDKNTAYYFNIGDLEFIVNFIYHFPQCDNGWFYLNDEFKKLDEHDLYLEIFRDDSNIFLFKKIGFYPELLLSKDDDNRTLSFLFLFFLPCIKNNSLLFHFSKKIPLICCNGITNRHFEMLLYLMKELEENEFKLLCEHRNLNHILMEDFMNTCNELYSFNPKTNWNKILPIFKIHKLLDFNCGFNMFETYMSDSQKTLFSNLPEILNNIQKEYEYHKLKVSLKEKFFIDSKLIKI